MPSPSLIEICSRSFLSIQSTVHQLIHSYAKTEEENSSPNLSWIQSLPGSTPGLKHKSFNAIIRNIVNNERAHHDVTTIVHEYCSEASPAILALIRTHVALELKLDDAILEALKSTDIRVVKKALKADWLFSGANAKVKAANFADNILPFISLRTRCGVIKKLAIGLKGYPDKAEAFFDLFTGICGAEASISILTACSEEFIYDRILKHKIVLSLKIINSLYEKYPELAIKYLRLGNPNNTNNEEDRKCFSILINEYDTFIPKLIRRHPTAFAELYEVTPEKLLKLSNTRTLNFVKSLRDLLIEKPYIYLKILSLGTACKSLKSEEFEKICLNLLTRDRTEINVELLLNFMDYCPHEDKLQFLKNAYKDTYNKNLMEDKSITKESKFWKLLSMSDRETLASRCFENSRDKKSDLFYLHPRDSIARLRKEISSANEAKDRFQFIGQMIRSCSLYDSKEDLLVVLAYYYDKHKNERDLFMFLENLSEYYDLKSLDDQHWFILQKIMYHAHIKGDLFKSKVSLVKSILEAALHHLLIVQEEQDIEEIFLNNLFEIIIESRFETCSSTWNVLKERTKVEKRCLEEFLNMIPHMYPKSHDYWRNYDNKLAMLLSLAKSISNYNITLKKDEENERIKIENYTWLTSLLDEFFTHACPSSFRKSLLFHHLRMTAPNFFYSKIDEHSTVLDIDDLGEAVHLLKHSPTRILANWLDYLSKAQDKLSSENKLQRNIARKFVSLVKWCHELPGKFVERCLLEIEVKGSIQILGILLEGDLFGKIVEPYLPKKNSEADLLNNKDLKKTYDITKAIAIAAKYPEPPVSLNFISAFIASEECQSEIGGTCHSISYRYPVKDVLGLADELVIGNSVVMKKFGVMLLFRCLRKDRQANFAEMLSKTETNSSVSEILSEKMLEIFSRTPTEENWNLVKECIFKLNSNSRLVEKFADLATLKLDHRFLGKYVEVFLDKIESLYRSDSCSQSRTNCVCLVILSINNNAIDHINESVCRKILNRYFLDPYSLEISQAVQSFAIRLYLLPATKEKFQTRLKVIMDILRKIVENVDASDPKKPRFYPANYTLTEFFSDTLTEIAAQRPKHSLEIVDKMLELFHGELSPWQVSTAYLSFNLFKEYLLAKSSKDFGRRCGKRIAGLIEDLSASEIMIADVADCLDKFVMEEKIYPDALRPNLRFDLIEGLMGSDDYYGALVGTHLVKPHEVNDYDHRYDEMLKKIGLKKNKTLQYSLYKHINEVRFND